MLLRRNFRANMTGAYECSRGDFCCVASLLAAFLGEPPRNVEMYTLRVYTKGGAGERRGAGPDARPLRSKGFNHFVLIWVPGAPGDLNPRIPAPDPPLPRAAPSSPLSSGTPSPRDSESQLQRQRPPQRKGWPPAITCMEEDPSGRNKGWRPLRGNERILRWLLRLTRPLGISQD